MFIMFIYLYFLFCEKLQYQIKHQMYALERKYLKKCRFNKCSVTHLH